MNRQLIGSLLVAALSVVVTILVVDAKLRPPMSEAEQQLRDERLEQQEERREDRD